MEVLKRKSADNGIRLLMLSIILCVVGLSACAQNRVYDIVSNKDIKPKKLFRKGNYVTDVHLDKYVGMWESGQYTFKAEMRKNVEIDGVYRDEINGLLIKSNEQGGVEFRLEFKMNSSTQTSAYGRFIKLDRYDFFIHYETEEKLRMTIGKNEVVRIQFENEEDPDQELKNVDLPTELVFMKKAQ